MASEMREERCKTMSRVTDFGMGQVVSFGGGNNVFSSFHLRGDRYARPLSRNKGLVVSHA